MTSVEEFDVAHCPRCREPMEAVVGAWWCAPCEIRVAADPSRLAIGEDRASRLAWGDAAVSALANVLPGVGTLAGLVVDGTIAARNAASLERWLAILDERFARVGRMFNPDDPLAIANFNRLTQGALQTHRTERRHLLANAVVNGGRDSAFEDALQRRLVDLTLRLEPEHIGYMHLLLRPADYLRSAGMTDPRARSKVSLDQLFKEAFLRDVAEFEILRDAVTRDLMNEGLISSGYGAGSTIADVVPHPITPLGLRLLDFLDLPEGGGTPRPARTGSAG